MDISNSYNLNNGGTVNIPTQNYSVKRALTKSIILILSPLVILAGSVYFIITYYFIKPVSTFENRNNDMLVAFPMQDTNWQDLGVVIEPVIPIQIKTKEGYKENKFLLDSGAVISSLSREWADVTGQDLAFLPRSTFRGFGNTQSFAYQGNMIILIGSKEMSLPVVFTEGEGTKSLLGRKGFFENNSIFFNHQTKQVEIYK